MKLSAPIYRLRQEAKLSARKHGTPLHQSLDEIAQREGFSRWSLLVARSAKALPASRLSEQLQPCDLVLLAGRPGHGKTTVGLEVVSQTVKAGNSAYFFTLEFYSSELEQRLSDIGFDLTNQNEHFHIDTSDQICADYIISQLADAPKGSIVVIDYMQVLDQKRDHATLDVQLMTLRRFADVAGITFVLICQIDRAFEQSGKDFPGIEDVRLPNPVDLSVFNKFCFVHNERMSIKNAA